jgi:hypothetical protein
MERGYNKKKGLATARPFEPTKNDAGRLPPGVACAIRR